MEDCLLIIFRDFDYQSLLLAEIVCKKWLNIIRSNPNLFWWKMPQTAIRMSIRNSLLINCEDISDEIIYALETNSIKIQQGSERRRVMCDVRF